MKNLKDFLYEDFSVTKKGNINKFKYIPETGDVVRYFELEELCDDQKNKFKRAFISEEELEEIAEKLDDFFEKVQNEPDYKSIDSFTYVSNKRERSINNNGEVNGKFKRDTYIAQAAEQAFNMSSDKDIIFKKETITIETSISEGLVIIIGPYGGIRICCVFG